MHLGANNEYKQASNIVLQMAVFIFTKFMPHCHKNETKRHFYSTGYSLIIFCSQLQQYLVYTDTAHSTKTYCT